MTTVFMFLAVLSSAATIAVVAIGLCGHVWAKDAERYQWVRRTTTAVTDDTGQRVKVNPTMFDETVDAAIAKEKLSPAAKSATP